MTLGKMEDAASRYRQKQHPGVLCAVHPDKRFDFSEKAYGLQRGLALKAFVDQWLHISIKHGSFNGIYDTWFNEVLVAAPGAGNPA